MPTDFETSTHIEQAQQQAFIDATPFQEEETKFVPAQTDVTENGMDLSHFFDRPLLITSWEWDDGTTFFQQLAPWFEYFSHPTIWPKLLGFSRMTANLEVEFRINGSPFRFSQLMVSYRPLSSNIKSDGVVDRSLSDFSGGYIPEDGVTVLGTALTTASSTPFSIVARSQRRVAYMDVARSEGCKMVLPFIFPFECFRVNSLASTAANYAPAMRTLFGQELMSMGTITLESLAILRNLQTASTAGVTIDVFVRAVNVKAWLASGVATAVPQGAERKPSQMASSAASVASTLKRVPVIGSYATLAETLATAGSRVLELFGFTPRPDTSLPSYVSGYSSTIEPSLTFPKKVRPLGLDHNNNVVIDPGIFAGDSTDPLAFSNWCSRSALMARTYFDAALNVGDPICLLPVSPFHYQSELVTDADQPNTRRFQMHPTALAALNFRNWRGTMCVRLQAITTQFHRGRLRVAWEPEVGSYSGLSQASLYTTYEGYQQMINWDLSASKAVTLKVGFGARKGRLAVPRFGSPALSDMTFVTNTEASPTSIATGALGLDNYEDYFNGFLRVSVLTKLQAPDTTYPVPIMVHVWYEDMEFYDPLDNGPNLSITQNTSFWDTTFPTESGTFTRGYVGTIYTAEDTVNLMNRRLCYDTMYPQGEDNQEHTFQPSTSVHESVYEGEKVLSLRSLLQRDVFYDTIHVEVPRAETQMSGQGLKTVNVHSPPSVTTVILPVLPYSFGTSSPCRNTVMTIGTPSPGYPYTGSGGTARTFYPNMARTNLFPLIRECFVGFRGSYNWKFYPMVESGCRVSTMAAARSNYWHTSNQFCYNYPRPIRSSPYTDQNITQSISGPTFANSRNIYERSLLFDTGNTLTPAKFAFRDIQVNIQHKLTSIRRFLNFILGTYASGATLVDTREQRTLGIRIPYFSQTRFLPGSTTGWFNANSNAELAQQIRLTFITEGMDQHASLAPGYSDAEAAYTSVNSAILSCTPPRAHFSVAMICSAGDDISFGDFVNVPAFYATSAVMFNDTTPTNS